MTLPTRGRDFLAQFYKYDPLFKTVQVNLYLPHKAFKLLIIHHDAIIQVNFHLHICHMSYLDTMEDLCKDEDSRYVEVA